MQNNNFEIIENLRQSEKFISLMKTRRNLAIGSIVFLIILGTIVFKFIEHWSWINAFYFVVSTSATVGLGDVVPQTNAGKIITSVYILTMVPIILYCFTLIAQLYFNTKAYKVNDRKNKNSQN